MKKVDANAVYTLVLQIIPDAPAATVGELSEIITAAMGDERSMNTRPDGMWSDAGCVLLSMVQNHNLD